MVNRCQTSNEDAGDVRRGGNGYAEGSDRQGRRSKFGSVDRSQSRCEAKVVEHVQDRGDQRAKIEVGNSVREIKMRRSQSNSHISRDKYMPTYADIELNRKLRPSQINSRIEHVIKPTEQ